MFAPVVATARAAGLPVRGYLSMCFGDPWEGPVPLAQVVGVATELIGLGCTELSLGDTIGVATPGQVRALLALLAEAGVPARTSSRCTFTTPTARRWPTPWPRCRPASPIVDASAGGLGGCPYAESATGNLATEDLVWQLTASASRPASTWTALVATSVWMAGQLGRPSPSRVVQALAG